MSLPSKLNMGKILKALSKLLRVQDWDIEFRYVDQYEMKHVAEADNLNFMMLCERFRLRKEALIYINVDHGLIDTGWYEGIVHELYHIVTGDICDMVDDLMDENDSSTITRRQKKQAMEVMVVNLAKIFVSVYDVKKIMKLAGV